MTANSSSAAAAAREAFARLGAHVIENGTRFGVWAPKATSIDVQIETSEGIRLHRLDRDADGVHEGFIGGVAAGARYRFRVDGDDAFPDPRSRFQPDGVHGASEAIDPRSFQWTDDDWPGISIDRLIAYELHIGTYTEAGTFEALINELAEIARLGVTAIEIMPVADFPGRWNWGYDGVDWFAPSRAYGRPDDFRRLVDAAHGNGLAVILDVVYNHFGPDGNYVRVYSDHYFTDRHATPWGEAINYDGPGSAFVRDFVLDAVRDWITEYHIDGLRLDATDTIVDDSSPHILAEIRRAAHSATERNVVVIAEEARNSVRTIGLTQRGGFGIDAVWADDFHHELRVLLTNAHENYYADYTGSTTELALAINEGFVYQGQFSMASGEPRGSRVTDEPATSFVFCIQNHDQVGNRPFGERLNHEIEAGRYAVASALLLLVPETPLLFMGQEFSASTPFLYFTDHEPELGKLVTEGRRREFGGFRGFRDERLRESIPDPQSERTFLASKLKLDERQRHAGVYRLYQDLIALRKSDPVLSQRSREGTHARSLGGQALVVHRWSEDHHRWLIANFGSELCVTANQIEGYRGAQISNLSVVLSTTDEKYGHTGTRATIEPAVITIPARSAVLLAPGR